MFQRVHPVLLLAFLTALPTGVGIPAQEKNQVYIDNGKLRLGVDLASGGSTFFFSQSQPERNLLNHFDRGRFIQQSYYGDPDGSFWGKKSWNWNPVQGGDYKGNAAKLLKWEKTGTTLYTRSVPKHWASGADISTGVMEQWIELTGEVAHLRLKFTYKGDKDHKPRHQELPAVFVDSALPNLVYYQGEKPWTGGKLTKFVPGWPNQYKSCDECWAAFVDENDWGIGVFFPGTKEITCYRAKGSPGPKGSGSSYFAPIRTMAITRDFVLEYNIYLTIGRLEEIRNRFATLHKK